MYYLCVTKPKNMTTTNASIKNLTKNQLSTFNTLVRLGDSKELALKTVLEMQEFNSEIYKLAYTN